ncbi:hypothetical protein [Haloglomus salinum]|uniref:hypothetical protein n=1 Tax=Haloglomus salinum TaxID=2962673 RepID=UPI0020C9E5A9|nr:hypothetical protein [Haloglomus salinum]
MEFSRHEIAPLTTETHFTEPIRSEQTAYEIERFTHRIPLDWFLVLAAEIDAWTYEHYLENQDLFEYTNDDYTVIGVDFEYEAEPVNDGTGKPFRIDVAKPTGEELTCSPRTHYLLGLLDYDEETEEVVAVVSTNERDGVLVTVQERLPHIPKR